MTALYIILGIIAFLIILLSVKFVITVHYEDDIAVSLGWLFLKFNLLPMKEKEKKPKKEKKEKKSEENSEVIPEPKEKKDNMFVRFYRNRGVSGVVQLLKDAAKALGGGFKRMGRAFLFEELFVSMTVGAGDSMVGGFLAGYEKSGDFAEALALGTAAGGATAFSVGIAGFQKIMAIHESVRAGVQRIG